MIGPPVTETLVALSTRSLSQSPVPSEDELVARASAGDRAAFRVLVERHEDEIAATVVGMLGPGADVDDVVQDVFIRFYRTLDRFRGEARVGTYLTRIAINRSLDVLRRRKRLLSRFISRDDEAVVPDTHGVNDETVERRERSTLVHQAIQQLPPKYRAVVVLRLIEEYSTEETAQILEIPYGTVLSRLSRAQAKLKTLLAPYIE